MTIAPPTPTVLGPLVSHNDVIFDEVARNQWRVLDARVSQGDVTALLGFVCLTAGVYEVTYLARPLETTICPDLPAARKAFLAQA